MIFVAFLENLNFSRLYLLHWHGHGGEKYLHRQQNFIKLEVTTTISQPEHSIESIIRPFVVAGPKFYFKMSIHEIRFD